MGLTAREFLTEITINGIVTLLNGSDANFAQKSYSSGSGCEPRGHVFGADPVERYPAERRQDAGLEVDAHSLAIRRLPVRIAAPTRPAPYRREPGRHVGREPAPGRQAARPPATPHHSRLCSSYRRASSPHGREGREHHPLGYVAWCRVCVFERHLMSIRCKRVIPTYSSIYLDLPGKKRGNREMDG